ncbi:hypothetical protein [Trichlorobacter lovleyi]|nr:hypothetical protein [Trichlorobacter lovleyi]
MMIKFRLSGERNTIHALVNQVRSAFPDAIVASHDANDRLSAKIDFSLPIDEALQLFLSSQHNSTIISPDDQQKPYKIDWRKKLLL